MKLNAIDGAGKLLFRIVKKGRKMTKLTCVKSMYKTEIPMSKQWAKQGKKITKDKHTQKSTQ